MDYSESLITCIRVVNSSQHLNFPSPWEKDGGCDIYSKRPREEMNTRLSSPRHLFTASLTPCVCPTCSVVSDHHLTGRKHLYTKL